MNTKPIRTMLLGIMFILVGIGLVPTASGSGLVIPGIFFLTGLVIGVIGYNQNDR